ncbi:uncharacterized protein LOC134572220 [Pelobates fuscus]|uniref:uncharacterized protein LOC134572220 n=1 Tax=Pelobates fuscus TaxID=191477 RepID=UPI002FE4D01B
MNRQDKQTSPFIVPVAIATPDFPTHCEMATVNITQDLASEHVEVAEPDSTQDVDEERLEQVVSHPEQLEHCTKIWETSQELSFSSGSLSFVTSTPVTGLSHYRFIIKSEQPMQYDPNFTFTNLEAQIKELEMKGQSKLKLLHRGSLVKRGMTRGSMLPRVSRSNVPVAVEKSKLMEPPCAPKFGHGSLPQATEGAKKLTKEHLPNNDLPGGSNCFRRGMVCPSLSRNTTVGIAQKNLGESARQLVYHKPINGLYTLKATAAKIGSHSSNSKLPSRTTNKPTAQVAHNTGIFSLRDPSSTNLEDAAQSVASLTACQTAASGNGKSDFIRVGPSICPPPLTGSQTSPKKIYPNSGLPRLAKKI